MTDSSIDPTSVPSRRSRWVSIAIWCVIIATFTTFRGRHPSELMKSGGIDWQVKFQALTWVLLGVVGVYFWVSGRADRRLIRGGPLLWYLGFVVLALASSLWSTSPLLTAFRAAQHGVAVLLIISMREQLIRLATFAAIYIGVNWVLVLLSVSGMHGGINWIEAPEMQGDFLARVGNLQWRFMSRAGHPSHVSIVAAVAAISVAARWRAPRLGSQTALGLWFIATTILTVSRTAIAGLAGGLLVVLTSRRQAGLLLCLAGVLIPLALMIQPIRDVTTAYLRRGQTANQFSSMTGRLPVYAKALQRAEDHYLLGEGFQSARVEPIDEGWLHSHNLLLEALNSLGVIGVTFCVLIILVTAGYLVAMWLRTSTQLDVRTTAVWENAGMLAPLLAFCILDVGFMTAVNAVVLMYIAVLAKVRHDYLQLAPDPKPRVVDRSAAPTTTTAAAATG